MEQGIRRKIRRLHRKACVAIEKYRHGEKRAAKREIGRLGELTESLEKTLFDEQAQHSEEKRLSLITEDSHRRTVAEKDRTIASQSKQIDDQNTELVSSAQYSYIKGLERNPTREPYFVVDNSGSMLYQSAKAEKFLGPQGSLGDFVYRDDQAQGYDSVPETERMNQLISDIIGTDYNSDSRQKSGILLVQRGKKPTHPIEITNENILDKRGAKVATLVNIKASGRMAIGRKDVGDTTFFQQRVAKRIRTTGGNTNLSTV